LIQISDKFQQEKSPQYWLEKRLLRVQSLSGDSSRDSIPLLIIKPQVSTSLGI
jgi:hypothetical protein